MAIKQPSAPPGRPYKHKDFLRFLVCRPFFVMFGFLVVEAALAAATTALIIQAGYDVAKEAFLITDFVWIVVAQSASYIVGATSWVFAERAGFGAFGRYMMRFARDNRHLTSLLGDKTHRETVEPFLTNETFHIFFELVYELEADLKLFFGLIFNAAVLGYAIDAGLPLVYALVFVLLLTMQWLVRKPVAQAYLNHQKATNRMTAHTYTAWDNIFSGNRYNFRLWHDGFKQRLRAALAAQIRAILAREGLATVSGIVSLAILFAYLAMVAARDVGDTGLLIALAATLPRQIELSSNVYGLASGWNDLLAVWTRVGGACNAMHPQPDAQFEARIRFDDLVMSRDGQPQPCISVAEALSLVTAASTARFLVRGSNGSGKSTLLVALKSQLGSQAFYWPTADKLAFAFDTAHPNDDGDEEVEDDEIGEPSVRAGFSSGERQLKSLQEIVDHSRAKIYLFDEWDANLDAKNRAEAERLVRELATRAVVVEISHRDRT